MYVTLNVKTAVFSWLNLYAGNKYFVSYCIHERIKTVEMFSLISKYEVFDRPEHVYNDVIWLIVSESFYNDRNKIKY